MLTHSLLYPQYLHFQNSTTTLIIIPIQRKYNLLLTLHKMIQPNWRQCVFSYVSFINTFMEAKDTRFLIKSFSSGTKKLLKGNIVILPSLRVRKVLFFSSFFTSDFFLNNFVFSSTKQLCKFAEHCKRSNQYSPQCNLSKEESLSRPHFLIACLRWLARYPCLSINNSVLCTLQRLVLVLDVNLICTLTWDVWFKTLSLVGAVFLFVLYPAHHKLWFYDWAVS